MWSDNITARIEKARKEGRDMFDLECDHPERGCATVQENIPMAEAIKIAKEGGVEDAESKLSCAFSDQNCVTIQRPDKYPELLVPHDWDTV